MKKEKDSLSKRIEKKKREIKLEINRLEGHKGCGKELEYFIGEECRKNHLCAGCSQELERLLELKSILVYIEKIEEDVKQKIQNAQKRLRTEIIMWQNTHVDNTLNALNKIFKEEFGEKLIENEK